MSGSATNSNVNTEHRPTLCTVFAAETDKTKSIKYYIFLRTIPPFPNWMVYSKFSFAREFSYRHRGDTEKKCMATKSYIFENKTTYERTESLNFITLLDIWKEENSENRNEKNNNKRSTKWQKYAKRRSRQLWTTFARTWVNVTAQFFLLFLS